MFENAVAHAILLVTFVVRQAVSQVAAVASQGQAFSQAM
jgi:hypothetical protein